MQKSISVGISFPKKVIEKIDEERGDISRSKYLLRILERSCLENDKKR
jgi:metal-responsive CopG/Arc/MetJ family transcriptional regulator